MKVYSLLLNTESGDEFQWAFTSKPSEDQVFSVFKRDIPDELGDDPDDKWGSASYWRIEEIIVEQL